MDFLNKQNPTAQLDRTVIRFPKTARGYLGDEIPYFIIPVVHRRKSLQRLASTSQEENNSAAAPASPTFIPFRLDTPISAHPSPEPKTSPTAASSSASPPPPATATAAPAENKPTKPAEEPKKSNDTKLPAPVAITATTGPVISPNVTKSILETKKPTTPPPTEDDVIIDDESAPLSYQPNLNAPPKMSGWLRKRGHVVQSWKMRYFVLDNGFLTYYVDKLDVPPYGKTMKGQLCLAGFRENAILGEDKQIDLDKMKAFEDERQSYMADPTNTAGGSAKITNRRASGYFTSEPMLRIHLVYVQGLINEEVAEDIRNTVSQNKEKEGANKGGDDLEYEFMMEAASLEEKYAWLAAIEAHTNYIETVSRSGAGDFKSRIINFSVADTTPTPLFNKSPSSPPSSTPASANPETPVSEEKQRAVSTINVGSGKRMSVLNNTATNQKWKIFLKREEEFVANGLTGKPNPIGIQELLTPFFPSTFNF